MRLAGRPTLQTLAVFIAVLAVQFVLAAVGAGSEWLFLLGPDAARRPWTLATHVYAHAGPAHLLGNALVLLVVGALVSRRTSTLRFHAFFLLTGMVSGLAEVTLGSAIGPPTAVIGASGAIFALLGYLLAGNAISSALIDRVSLSPRAQAGLFLGVAVLLTLATASPRAALFGHATGLVCGLLAGRTTLLEPATPAVRTVR
jgi:membrane associated rhomboid family serine protease